MPKPYSREQLTKQLQTMPCHFVWPFDHDALMARSDRHLEVALDHLERNPNNPSVLNFLGYLYVQRGGFEKAEQYFTLCQTRNPRDLVSVANLAHCYALQEKTAHAANQLERYQVLCRAQTTAQRNYSEGLAHWSHGYIHARLFDNETALSYYQAAYDKTSLAEPLIDKAKLYNHEYEFKQALEILQRFPDQNSLVYLLELGRALRGCKQLAKSREVYERILSRDPNNVQVLGLLSAVFQAAGNENQALALLNRAIGLQGTTQTYHRRGLLYLQAKDRNIKSPQKARADLEKAVELCPTNQAAVFPLVTQIYLKSRNRKWYEKGLTLCAELRRTEVSQNQLFYVWGSCLLRLNRLEEATAKFYESLTSSYSSDPVNHRYDRSYQTRAAEVLRTQYKQQYASESLAYYEHLADVEVRVGRRRQAIVLCEEGVTRFPDSALLHEYWGRALVNEGDYPQALQRFQEARSKTDDQEEQTRIDKLRLKVYWKMARDQSRQRAFSIEERLQAYLNGLKIKLDIETGDPVYHEFAGLLAGYMDDVSINPDMLSCLAFLLPRLPQSVLPDLTFRLCAWFEAHEKLMIWANQHPKLLAEAKAMHRDEARFTFHPNNPKQLRMMRCAFIDLKESLLDPAHANIEKHISALMTEVRRMLDYLFIKFVRENFEGEIERAFFPCVPEAPGKDDIERRLQSYLESKRHGQPFLGLRGFRQRFPALFKYLLSIQPLVNREYQWLRRLYDMRNLRAHESLLPRYVTLDGERVDMSLLACRSYAGVEEILVSFYRAYCQDCRVDFARSFESRHYRLMINLTDSQFFAHMDEEMQRIAAHQAQSSHSQSVSPDSAAAVGLPQMSFLGIRSAAGSRAGGGGAAGAASADEVRDVGAGASSRMPL